MPARSFALKARTARLAKYPIFHPPENMFYQGTIQAHAGPHFPGEKAVNKYTDCALIHEPPPLKIGMAKQTRHVPGVADDVYYAGITRIINLAPYPRDVAVS